MKKQLPLFLAILFVYALPLQAQVELTPCGNTDYYSPWLRDYLDSGANLLPRNEDVLYVPLQIHIVGTDEGSGYMSKSTALQSFCTLNTDFADAEIQFFLVDDINYIDNTLYYDHEYEDGYDMMNQNNVNNAINCYIVDSPAGNCGYFSPGADGIALSKSCTMPDDHTWAHEVGHFLSLPHTFWGWEWADELNFDEPAPNQIGNVNVEKVDGSNCSNSGDRFCDTPADYIRYRWNCNNDGVSNITQIDPDGVEFTSDGSFFMSYANSSCMARFSDEQVGAMKANIEDQRPGLLTTSPEEESIEVAVVSNLTVVSPLEGTVTEGSSVRVEWEPVSNATHYIVQINPFPIFSIIFNEFVVETPYVDFTNLIADETFFWRVRPYNPYYTCTSFTQPESFDTGSNIVSTTELREGESVELFPNPIRDGNVWMEITSLASTTAEWEISNLSGQVILRGEQEMSTGTQKIKLDCSILSNGMYLAGLKLGDSRVYRKFIVQ